MEFAKVTSKGQMTIPKSVRERCHLGTGDVVSVSVEGSQVIMRKIVPPADEYLQGVESGMEEWSSPEDDEAWRDL